MISLYCVFSLMVAMPWTNDVRLLVTLRRRITCPSAMRGWSGSELELLVSFRCRRYLNIALPMRCGAKGTLFRHGYLFSRLPKRGQDTIGARLP